VSLLGYDQTMVPPRWPDEQGRLIPTYPCRRCGREVPSRFRGFRVENLRRLGWALFQPTSYVNWCGHAHEIIPMPLADGRVTFVPVLGGRRANWVDDLHPNRTTRPSDIWAVLTVWRAIMQKWICYAELT